jgi:uncharacterized membrane protein
MHISFSYKTLVLTPNQEQTILFLEFNFFCIFIIFYIILYKDTNLNI